MYFTPLLKGFPLALDTGTWGQKTRMVGLSGPRKKFDEIFSCLDTVHQLDHNDLQFRNKWRRNKGATS